MHLKNTQDSYGIVHKLIHWITAVTTIALFALGLWMVQLGYYDDWYQSAPHYHVSIGLLLAVIMLFRIVWRNFNTIPLAPPSHTKLERNAAHWAHIFIYGLLLCIFISGYLIPTADNRGIDVFNWFTLPASGELLNNQEDIFGNIHLWSAYALIALVSLHAIAAIKHHFIDKDITLKRML